MSEQRGSDESRSVDEKQRVADEKELQKHDEKDEKDEKTFEEKNRQDPIGSMVWAATLIWAGLLLLAGNLGWFESFRIPLGDRGTGFPFDLFRGVEWAGAWQLFFLGAGGLVLVGVAARLLIPEYRRPVLGSLIWAIVLFGIALGKWELIWPIILIAVGISILFGGALRRRR
jgi:hypothetical protein